MKNLSIVTTILIVLLTALAFWEIQSNKVNIKNTEITSENLPKTELKRLNYKIIKEYKGVDSTKAEIEDSLLVTQTHAPKFSSGLNKQVSESNGLTSEERTFYAKFIFSLIFCISALFVILSNKYDQDTKKWAFNILALIAGVWIGSVAK